MKMRFSNNAVSLLANTISPGATSFSVASSHGALFPTLSTGQFCYARLGTDSSNELVKVTARSGDSFTCEETVDGWSAGTVVALTVSAELLEELAQADGGGQLLKDHELKDYSETVQTPSSSSGVFTIDMESGNVASATLTENVTTFTISNPPATGKTGSLTLFLKQDGTGSRTVSWPSSVKWAGGQAPTLSTDANSVDLIAFITLDAGTTWYGIVGGLSFA